jgi:hypothetical protein
LLRKVSYFVKRESRLGYNFTRVWFFQPREHFYRSAFARAVFADNAKVIAFINAEIKIFLTASVNERAQRRYAELKAKGVDCVLEDIKADIEKRDYNDTHRALAPLKKADDAVEIDTTGVNVEGVTALILKLISERK